MESSVVLFKPRIHLFACTHPSVSNSLVCNDWLAYKHQSTALCSNTWFLTVYKHQSPAVSFKHVWFMVLCLCTRTIQQPFVSNTSDCGCLFVYKYLCLEPKWLRLLGWRACSSVAVRDRGHWKCVVGRGWARIETGGKVIALKCASKNGRESRCIGIVHCGDSSEESWTWLSQIVDDGKNKYRARFAKQEFWRQKRKLWEETPWSRVRGQNSVDKEFLDIVGNGSPTGRMKRKHRKPGVPEEEVPVEECFDGLARITISEEMIAVLTRCSSIVFELICSSNACNFTRRRFCGSN